ncbi:hypothetical protein ACH5RR_024828 [Cinchona calisaya]|uniref:KIB1-4 beta-propeller domain-containing protein n=1 Tax=Cinchona calisaya TaxID=153742 RepID=A0ABD2YZX6_9GENT
MIISKMKKALVGCKRKKDDEDKQDVLSYSEWTKLGIDMMEIILKKMRLSFDIASVFRVCQPYLVKLPYSRLLYDSWMVNVKKGKKLDMRHPTLDEKYCVGSSRGWLILKEGSYKVCLVNLLNGANVHLPKWDQMLSNERCFLSSSPISGDCTVLIIGKFGLGFCGIGDSRWKHNTCNQFVGLKNLLKRES